MARAADSPREFGSDDLMTQAKEYVNVKEVIEVHEKRKEELRSSIFKHIDENGYEDDKGNFWLELPEPIDDFVSFKKQKRVAIKLNEEVAMRIIEEKGLKDRLVKLVEKIDEDELLAALYDGTLTQEEVDEMSPPNITWALTLSKK